MLDMENNKSGRSPVRTELVKRLVNELYQGHLEQRSSVRIEEGDRRTADRRQCRETVLIDTRSPQSRRSQAGRRWGDINENNRQKIGIDFYA